MFCFFGRKDNNFYRAVWIPAVHVSKVLPEIMWRTLQIQQIEPDQVSLTFSLGFGTACGANAK